MKQMIKYLHYLKGCGETPESVLDNEIWIFDDKPGDGPYIKIKIKITVLKIEPDYYEQRAIRIANGKNRKKQIKEVLKYFAPGLI